MYVFYRLLVLYSSWVNLVDSIMGLTASLLIPQSQSLSSLFINPLRIAPSVDFTTGINVTFMFLGFLVLRQGLGTYISFYTLLFLLWGPSARQNSQFSCFFLQSLGLVF